MVLVSKYQNYTLKVKENHKKKSKKHKISPKQENYFILANYFT